VGLGHLPNQGIKADPKHAGVVLKCLSEAHRRRGCVPVMAGVRHKERIIKDYNMTPKQFYDWQTAGGTDDVMRLVDCLERADLEWCAIGGVAVNHWAAEAMVTQDVDFVVAAESVDLQRNFSRTPDSSLNVLHGQSIFAVVPKSVSN